MNVTRTGGIRVQHYTGARPTYVTFRGVAELTDGSRVKCPHDGHRTAEAAARCANRVVRKGES